MLPRRSIFVILILVAAASVVVALRLRSGGGEEPPVALPGSPEATATVSATPTASLALPPTATSPPATPSSAGVDVSRILVPALGIDAPTVVLGVDPDGTMQSPDNPEDVAWYSFSARPGEGSNVVMAGHLDWAGYGPAVFYSLKEAEQGDDVQLLLVDGTTARYRVLDVVVYDEASAPVQEIVGPTDSELVTLITCGGSFDPASREYDKRVVVRAERMPETAVTP